MHVACSGGGDHIALRKDTWAGSKTAGKEGGAEGRRKRGGGLRKGEWRVDGHEVGPGGRTQGGTKGPERSWRNREVEEGGDQ